MKIATTILALVALGCAQKAGDLVSIGADGTNFPNAPAPRCSTPGGQALGTRSVVSVKFNNFFAINIRSTAGCGGSLVSAFVQPISGNNVMALTSRIGQRQGRMEKVTQTDNGVRDTSFDLVGFYWGAYAFTAGVFIPVNATLTVNGTAPATGKGKPGKTTRKTFKFNSQKQLQRAIVDFTGQRTVDLNITSISEQYGLRNITILIDNVEIRP